jgi:MraZ protein
VERSGGDNQPTAIGMFRGHFQHTVDDKGRVAIPACFRGVLSGLQEDRLVVTKFRIRGRPCLDAYPPSAWRELEGRILGKGRFDPVVLQFRRAYVSAAQECPLDPQGRILVPPTLREHAGLEREVMLAGDINIFRIWDLETWRKTAQEDEQIFDDPQLMKDLGL